MAEGRTFAAVKHNISEQGNGMRQERRRVGLIGYGSIGQEVARIIAKQAPEDIVLVGALVQHAASNRPPGPPLVTTRSALLAYHPQAVVEVAGHAGLREHGAAILQAGIDLFLVSTGALAEPALMEACRQAAQKGGAWMTIVPGAIGALDVLAAVSLEGEVARVIHTMRKPPHTLLPPAKASAVTSVQEVFRGSARQAVFRFP